MPALDLPQQFNTLQISNEDGEFARSGIRMIECSIHYNPMMRNRIKGKAIIDSQTIQYIDQLMRENIRRDLIIKPEHNANGNSVFCNSCFLTNYQWSAIPDGPDIYLVEFSWICNTMEVAAMAPRELFDHIGFVERANEIYRRTLQEDSFVLTTAEKEKMPVLDWHQFGF